MQNYQTKKNCVECDYKSACFTKLPEKELEFVNKNKIQIQFYPSENLCKQGAFVANVMFVTEGFVSLYIEGAGQKRQIVRFLTKGDYIGLSSLWGSKLYHYSAQALADTHICMIERDSLRGLIQRNLDFSNAILEMVSKEEFVLFAQIRNATLRQANGKLASSLLYLNQDKFKELNPFQYLTRKDIADFTGISLEGCIKILKDFEQEKIISIHKRDIQIIDAERLTQIERYG
jgi:CRP/FNR family transcriptional regulator, polysaccharide utilization system transcription regulator